MDDDDIITVDENEVEINGKRNANIEIISPAITNKTGRKRKSCLGLCSDLIAKYVNRTLAYYGGACRVEVIAKEMYPEKFPNKFTRKKLKPSQKRALNWKIYVESRWRIDKDCNAVRAKKCTGYSDSGKTICHESNKDAFKEKSVFTGLCEVMVQAAVRKDNNKGKQNIQYNEDFTNFLIILESFSTQAFNLFRQNLEGRTIQNIRKLRTNNEDTLTNPNLSFENVAKFKRLIDILNYQEPIVAMSDNTKLKPALRYNPVLGCIIGLTLSVEQTKINAYEDIQPIINDIKIKKAIAKDVRAYILQVIEW
uniref:Uncharacterized protein n=1 Tax=Rhizophagus irregularis (strain DAOM 181602 / DAOM 197198 / MUCL 43194) TaxID=747089 RepID=U9UV44_RHIID